MDFASLMSAQIAKSSSHSSNNPNDLAHNGVPKFQRRADIETAREKGYLADLETQEAERVAKAERKRKQQEEEFEQNLEREAKRQKLGEEARRIQREEAARAERERRKRIGLPETSSQHAVFENEDKGATPKVSDEEDVSEEILVARLRDLAEPTKLFGEIHDTRLRRYYRLLAKKMEAAKAVKIGSQNQPIPTNLEPMNEDDTAVAPKVPRGSDKEARLLLARRLTSWINLVLREWGRALAARDDATKESFLGQSATTSRTQALQHLRPLFRKLEQLPSNPECLPYDLLQPLTEIVNAAQERRYVDANDGYLKLSIGKAAWPIGVTMVGIHERSAREKLHGDAGQAHIMADEATRKMLQSMKRCLSFAQTHWPPDDSGQLMG